MTHPLSRQDLPAHHPQNVPLSNWTDGWLKMSVAHHTDVRFLLASDDEKRTKGWPLTRAEMIALLVERKDIPAAGVGAAASDWGALATRIAEAVLLELGHGSNPSRDPGADRRRDRLCAVIEPLLEAASYRGNSQPGTAMAVGEPSTLTAAGEAAGAAAQVQDKLDGVQEIVATTAPLLSIE